MEEEPTEPTQQDSLALPHVASTSRGAKHDLDDRSGRGAGGGSAALPWLLVTVLACLSIALAVGLVAALQLTPSEAKLRDQRDAARDELEQAKQELDRAQDGLRYAGSLGSSGNEGDGGNVTTVRRGAYGTDGSLAFKVVGVRPIPSFSTYSGTSRPKPGGRFYEARVVLRNDGKEKADPFCGGTGANLLDGDDRQFTQVTNAISLRGNATCMSGVAPGFSNVERLIFELPANATPSSLVLWDKEDGKDFFGNESSLRFELG